MSRLLSRLICLSTAIVLPSAVGQEAVTVTIIGDLAEPQNLQFPADKTVYVRDLLNQAGVNNPEGNAIVVRTTQSGQIRSDNFTPGSVHRGSLVTPGDIVVFRTLTSWTPDAQNAVVIRNGSAQVVRFRHADGLRLGHALSDFPQLPSGINVIRTQEFGTARWIESSPNDSLNHGDVIYSPEAGSSSALRVSTVSSVSTIGPDSELPGEKAASTIGTAGQGEVRSVNGSALMIPSLSQPVVSESESGEENQTGSTVGSVQFELKAEKNNAMDSANTPFRTATFSEETEPAIDSLDESILTPVPTAKSNESNAALWNGLFVLGIVFALGLIVIGWVKTQQEQPTESTSETTAKIRTADTSLPPIGLVADSDSAGSSEDLAEAIQMPSQDSVIEASRLSIDDNCPVLSAGFGVERNSMSDAAVAFYDQLPTSNINTGVDVQATEQSVSNRESEHSEVNKILVSEHEWFGDDWQKSEESISPPNDSSLTGESIQETPTDSTSNDSESTFEESDSVTDPVQHVASDWSDLEELVQNRIPLELKQADLPLRIVLFGKPAGPKRLRIDGAHSEIAPPHMLRMSQQTRRADPVVAQATVPSADRTSTNPSAEKVTSVDEIGRLDKALNYLKEQADS